MSNLDQLFLISQLQNTQQIPTAGFEEFLGVEEGFEHPLVEQHVAHRLRDDNVHLLRQVDLLNLPRYHLDCP